MAQNFDFGAIIKAMLENLLQVEILLILYTNSKSLYNYLVKFSITQKNCLIIDIISFCQ